MTSLNHGQPHKLFLVNAIQWPEVLQFSGKKKSCFWKSQFIYIFHLVYCRNCLTPHSGLTLGALICKGSYVRDMIYLWEKFGINRFASRRKQGKTYSLNFFFYFYLCLCVLYCLPWYGHLLSGKKYLSFSPTWPQALTLLSLWTTLDGNLSF